MALRLPSFRRRPESTHPRHRSITGAIQALLLAGFVILTAAACGEVGARPNNEGNEAYEQEDYEAAQSSYQEAKHNLEVALSRLPQVEQQQQQGGQQQGDQQQQQDGQQQEGQQQQDGDQQDDSQQPQDGQEQGGQQQQQDPGSGGTQQDQQPGSQQPQQQQPTPTTELTPEQARQLLSGVGDQTDTLQNQLQRQSGGGRQPEQDW